MKQGLTFILLFFLTTSVFSQGINGNGTNGWFFVPNACSTDSFGTYTYLSGNGSQSFRSAGNTITFNGINYFQSDWRKDFWESYPAIPDTFVLRVKFYEGGVNTIYTAVRISVQDSTSYSWTIGKEINLDNDWQEIKFETSWFKQFMSNFGRFYITFGILTSDSCYIWYEYGIDYIKGIDDTLGVIVYDTFGDETGISVIKETPSEFALEQNYPNPFNPSTKIRYSISIQSNVEIKLFDLLGNEIETLVNAEQPSGTYEFNWSTTTLPSGIYFYQLKAGDFIETKKMILMK